MKRLGLSKVRWSFIAIAATAALVLGSVTLAQDSPSFDLACRGALTTTGGIATGTNGANAVLSAVGQSAAGFSQGASWGIRAGYIQPQRSSTAGLSAASPVLSSTVQPQTAGQKETVGQNAVDSVFLPLVSAVARYVRPCNW